MRPLARAATLAALAAVALPGCIVAIDTGPDELGDSEEQRDVNEAHRDSQLLQLEERMDRIEKHLPR